MTEAKPAERYRRNRRDEIDSATVYEAMSTAESQPQLADVYRRLAKTEREHANFWGGKLRKLGVADAEP